DRFSPRERRLLLVAAVLVPLLTVGILFSRADPEPVIVVTASPSVADAGIAVPLSARPPAPVPPSATSSVPPPVTSPLPSLRLLGTSSGAGGGAAFFAYADGTQRRVATGRPVVEAWRLEAVGTGHAVLAADDGQTFQIEIERGSSNGAGAATADAQNPAAREAAPSEMPSLDTAASLAMQVRMTLTPADENDRRAGFRIAAPPPLLAAAGVRTGDILLRVNGSAFTTLERVDDLLDDLAMGRSVTLDLDRDGERQSVTIG
ncbi:MAG: PDZ domain-containing protein, partial [Pseudomonadota bacterium]